MIRVLIVDDSRVIRDYLTHILSSDPEIEVVATAASGYEAIKKTVQLKPDLITMDIHMPGMNGFDAARQIMQTAPTPVLIVTSSFVDIEDHKAFKALESGALAIIQKPEFGQGFQDHEGIARLVRYVKLMSEIKVVRRRKQAVQSPPKNKVHEAPRKVKLIVIGASTGGPIALQTMMKQLEEPLPVPVVIVQHIAEGFVKNLVSWLHMSTGVHCEIAVAGDRPKPGVFYFAKEGEHLLLRRDGSFMYRKGVPGEITVPAVDELFTSVAYHHGKEAIGIVLTGMGSDGAQGLKIMRERGAYTIAQDRPTSLIYSMPRKAVELGSVEEILPLAGIIPRINDLCGK